MNWEMGGWKEAGGWGGEGGGERGRVGLEGGGKAGRGCDGKEGRDGGRVRRGRAVMGHQGG